MQPANSPAKLPTWASVKPFSPPVSIHNLVSLMKNLLAAIFVVGAIGTPAIAMAQFSLPSIPGMGKSSAAPAADLGGQQSVLVNGYVSANKDVLTANSQMLDALGLKDKSATIKTTADQLKEGSTKDNLEAANLEVASSTNAVAAELAKAPKLDAQSKAAFGVGLISLTSGVAKYVGLGKSVSDMASGLSNASLTQLPSLQSAAFVVSKFPSAMSSVGSTLKNAIAFAQNNDIKIPSDATNLLSAMK